MKPRRQPWCLAGLAALALGLLGEARPAAAQTIIKGGSDLLSQAQANQLGNWLGEGAITINRVFTKVPGMTSVDFHAAADGKGRTFTVVEIDPDGAGAAPTRLVGGYNPQSWNSSAGFHLTESDAERTAFVFNLTLNFVHRQRKSSHPYNLYAHQQTYNNLGHGPVFGPANDLGVDNSLNGGNFYPGAYGPGGYGTGPNIYGTEGISPVYVGRLEVFTIGEGTGGEPSAVPEPGALALFLPALGAVALLRRRRKEA